MDYITVKEASKKWKLTERSIQNYCKNKKISGAKCIGKQWLIPADAKRPLDGRSKSSKVAHEIDPYHFPLFAFSPYFSLYTELSESEQMLYDAENLYLCGHYVECITKCRKIQSTTTSTSVKFGTFCVIGYASLVLGLYTECVSSINSMRKIIEKEKLHKEDYKLLLCGLVQHITRGPSELNEIVPADLSSEAMPYYFYLTVLHAIVNSAHINVNFTKLVVGLCEQARSHDIMPMYLCMNALSSICFSNIKDEENRKNHMQIACDLMVKYGWYSLLAKFYLADQELVNECLSSYDEKYRNKLLKNTHDIMQKWVVVHKLKRGAVPLPEFSIEQNAILVLLSNDIPQSAIAIIRDLSPDEVTKQLREIMRIANLRSLRSLAPFAKSRLNTPSPR